MLFCLSTLVEIVMRKPAMMMMPLSKGQMLNTRNSVIPSDVRSGRGIFGMYNESLLNEDFIFFKDSPTACYRKLGMT